MLVAKHETTYKGEDYLDSLIAIGRVPGLRSLLEQDRSDQIQLLFGKAHRILSAVESKPKWVRLNRDGEPGSDDHYRADVSEAVVRYTGLDDSSIDLVLTNGVPGDIDGDRVDDSLVTMHIRQPNESQDTLVFGDLICSLSADGRLGGEQNIAAIDGLLNMFSD